MALSRELFELYSNLIKKQFGIRLSSDKQEQLNFKLGKLLLRYGVASPEDYYRLLVSGSREHVRSLLEELTVHKTEYFREKHHFDFLSQHGSLTASAEVQKAGEFKAWSAGCSTGEEAYTLAMVLRDALPSHFGLRVLATDVSRKILMAAQRGVYPESIEKDIPAAYLKKYFRREEQEFVVTEGLRQLVSFREFNLMAPFPFRGKFNVIFCRNVMIYFDSPTQEALVEKFYNALLPGGYLFIGHSESLSNMNTKFAFVKPTIYIRGRRSTDS